MRRLLLSFILCLLLPGAAFAVNAITTGALTLQQTFECIGVKADYTQDDNGNATATIEFKATSSSTWLPAYTPYIDRRATIEGNSNTANQFQARVSIVGRSPGVSYDVRITWNDVDGVNGTNPVSGTITTLPTNPPLGGADVWVDIDYVGTETGSFSQPWNTIAEGVTDAAAGDTIRIKASSSTYPASTITKSGTSSAYIKFQGEPQAPGVTWGGGTTSITITGDFLWFYNFTLPASSVHGFYINGANDHVLLDTLTFSSVATANPGTYGDAGVRIAAGANNIWIRNSSFTKVSGNVDSFAIYFEANGNLTGGHVIADNAISGNFRDGIGGEGNTWQDGPVNNSDIARNTSIGVSDDGLEIEGHNINVRIWGNDITNNTGNAMLGIAGCYVGPLYVFRNFLHGTNALPATKTGQCPGPGYFFHNTINVTGAALGDGISDLGGAPSSDNFQYYNNIFKTARYSIYRGGRSNLYNYNLYNAGSAVADEYNTTGHYVTLANFQANTPHEDNGVEGDPLLNANGTLQSGSPARNVGVSIANFNDSNSAWPASGSAPDMGAFEFAEATVLQNRLRIR